MVAEHARIRDHNVEVVNIVGRLEGGDSRLCGFSDGRIVLEDDEFAAFACGESVEGLRSGMVGVPDEGNGRG